MAVLRTVWVDSAKVHNLQRMGNNISSSSSVVLIIIRHPSRKLWRNCWGTSQVQRSMTWARQMQVGTLGAEEVQLQDQAQPLARKLEMQAKQTQLWQHRRLESEAIHSITRQPELSTRCSRVTRTRPSFACLSARLLLAISKFTSRRKEMFSRRSEIGRSFKSQRSTANRFTKCSSIVRRNASQPILGNTQNSRTSPPACKLFFKSHRDPSEIHLFMFSI